jgi:FkbM family methyltransferase
MHVRSIWSLLRVRRPKGTLLLLREIAKQSRDWIEEEVRYRATYAYLGHGVGLCRALGRIKLYVDAGDAGLTPHLVLDGYWELWVTELLVRRLRSGMTAIDVGANVGYHALTMAELVGAHGKVHAFEPNPSISNLLARSAHVNGLSSRLTVHEQALGASDGERFRLFIPQNYPGGASLVPEEREGGGPIVESRRLDSYPELLDADLIKIDAEGGEQDIWNGMTRLVARGRPLVIILEFVLDRFRDPRRFLDEVSDAGFALYEVDEAEPCHRVTREQVLGWPPTRETTLVLIR